MLWREARLLQCLQKDHGVGPSVLEVAARDARVEQVQPRHSLVKEVVRQMPLSREDIERDALQEFTRVFRRGGCRQREAESVGKGVKLTGLDHLDHPLMSSTIHDRCYFSNKSIAKSINTVKQSGCVGCVAVWLCCQGNRI